jgi:hypothetical protein
MNTRDLAPTLTTLLGELLDGPPPGEAYMLNRGDAGLLRSLERLDARDASAVSGGGASIAAHVDHLRYGFSLMNRWHAGENPFDTADWGASWRTIVVSDIEWRALRAALEREARLWLQALHVPRDVSAPELHAIVGSIAHLAYHLGAVRQINRGARGPAEGAPASGTQ